MSIKPVCLMPDQIKKAPEINQMLFVFIKFFIKRIFLCFSCSDCAYASAWLAFLAGLSSF